MSENSGFAHVRHIIIINHGYLVNIDKILYYNTAVALSIGYNATSANMRRETLVSEEEVLEKSSTSEEKNPHLKVISGNSLVPWSRREYV